MGGRTKRTIRTKGNCLEVNVEILVFDDLLGPAVLVVGVTIGASSTYLTRQGVDGRVDGGVGDADVKDRFALVEQASDGEVAFTSALSLKSVGSRSSEVLELET